MVVNSPDYQHVSNRAKAVWDAYSEYAVAPAERKAEAKKLCAFRLNLLFSALESEGLAPSK